MHDDSEAMERSFLELLEELASTEPDSEEGQPVSPGSLGRNDGNALRFSDVDLDLFDLEDMETSAADHAGTQDVPLQTNPLFNSGEIPAVQDRFHALLKRRLQIEIQRHPPLFPWETEITDYDTENATAGILHTVDAAPAEKVPVGVGTTSPGMAAPQKGPSPVWLAQLQQLSLPVSMPEMVLGELFNQCQQVLQSSLREGERLVQAVESLFPGQNQRLNYLAGLVLASSAPRGSREQVASLESYETAAPAQQMVLSMLAAREIMDALTLTPSLDRPRVERQWQTDAGVLTLETLFDPSQTGSKLQVRGDLPCGGRLSFMAENAQATAQRANSGRLSVEVFDLPPNRTYTLEVQLQSPNPSPLIFAVHPVVEPSPA